MISLFHQKNGRIGMLMEVWIFLKSLKRVFCFRVNKDQISMLSYVNKSPIATYFQGRYTSIARSSRGLHLLLTCQPSSLNPNQTHFHSLGEAKSHGSCTPFLGQNLDGNHMTDKTAIDFREASWIRSDWLFKTRICHCIEYLWTNAQNIPN